MDKIKYEGSINDTEVGRVWKALNRAKEGINEIVDWINKHDRWAEHTKDLTDKEKNECLIEDLFSIEGKRQALEENIKDLRAILENRDEKINILTAQNRQLMNENDSLINKNEQLKQSSKDINRITRQQELTHLKEIEALKAQRPAHVVYHQDRLLEDNKRLKEENNQLESELESIQRAMR